jgi:hypothetical protein
MEYEIFIRFRSIPFHFTLFSSASFHWSKQSLSLSDILKFHKYLIRILKFEVYFLFILNLQIYSTIFWSTVLIIYKNDLLLHGWYIYLKCMQNFPSSFFIIRTFTFSYVTQYGVICYCLQLLRSIDYEENMIHTFIGGTNDYFTIMSYNI